MPRGVFYPGAASDTGYWTGIGEFFQAGWNGRYCGVGKWDAHSENSWIRFPSVSIPADVPILSAFIRVVPGEDASTELCELVIQGEIADNPGAPTSISDAVGRNRSGPIQWAPGPLMMGKAVDSQDITTIINSIRSQEGWLSGHAMQFYLLDNNSSYFAHRSYYSYGNGNAYPELHIEWGHPSLVIVSVPCVVVKLSAGDIAAQAETVAPAPCAGLTTSVGRIASEGTTGRDSVMWAYFWDKLRWPLIRLKRGALAMLAEGGAASLDDARTAILWLRDQFHPATAEATYLANYAASRGVRRHPSETETQFKQRVIRAWYWHYLGGKQLGLPQILRLYGYDGASIRNWREVDPTLWAEFWCNLLPPTTLELLSDDMALIVWTLNEYKPARSRLRGLTVTRQISGVAHAAVVAWSGAIAEVRPRIATEATSAGRTSAAVGHWSVMICSLYPPYSATMPWANRWSAWLGTAETATAWRS